jgi:hypothetical protein
MQSITDHLYLDPTSKEGKGGKKIKIESKPVCVERQGPTAIEFAYMIKTSEELGRDCDDAERILNVIYDIFVKICSYRANPETNPEWFIQVYRQQLENIYESLASAKIVCTADSSCREQLKLIITWFNQTNVFNTIPTDAPMDDKGQVCINQAFNVDESASIRRILSYIKSGKDSADDASTETAENV